MDYLNKRCRTIGLRFASAGLLIMITGIILTTLFLSKHRLNNLFGERPIIVATNQLNQALHDLDTDGYRYISIGSADIAFIPEANVEPASDDAFSLYDWLYMIESQGQYIIVLMKKESGLPEPGDIVHLENMPASINQTTDALYTRAADFTGVLTISDLYIDCTANFKPYSIFVFILYLLIVLLGACLVLAGIFGVRPLINRQIAKQFSSNESKLKAIDLYNQEMSTPPLFHFGPMIVTKNFVTIEELLGNVVIAMGQIYWFYKTNPDHYIKKERPGNRFVLIILNQKGAITTSPSMPEPVADDCVLLISELYPFIVTEFSEGPSEYDKKAIEQFCLFVMQRKEQYKKGLPMATYHPLSNEDCQDADDFF